MAALTFPRLCSCFLEHRVPCLSAVQARQHESALLRCVKAQTAASMLATCNEACAALLHCFLWTALSTASIHSAGPSQAFKSLQALLPV